ncbi:hypothetical protein [Dactylosporangium sp. CA-092794]|uniref:hypothetical protein n=1 Tax=Dactylosporangium sp. CA-092794 TaxID=3239929 RepID=UPI003D94A432
MTRALDVTAPVRLLAEAAALLVRLLTGRSPQPVHAAVRLCADETGLALTATDGALVVRLHVPATVHDPGEALVSRRGLADTLAGLDPPEARLVGEGGRLAVRVPGARFALPTLPDAWPAPATLPPESAHAPGPALRTAAAAVAGAASREHALPIFTGVRLRAAGGRLSLLATDRYRLATATVPLHAPLPPAAPPPLPAPSQLAAPARFEARSRVEAPAGFEVSARFEVPAGFEVPARFETLVPASLLARIAPVLGRADAVALHVAPELFALSWPGGSVTTPTLGDTFPDAQLDRLLDTTPECIAEVDADALAHAVDRATAYAGDQGRVTLQSIDGALLVRAADPLRGESEETVKAAIRMGQATRSYQTRLLSDALHAFPGDPVQLRIQPALRATELTTATANLRYLVVPIRPTDHT